MNAQVKITHPDYYLESHLAMLEVLQNLFDKKLDELTSLRLRPEVHIIRTEKSVQVAIDGYGLTFFGFTHHSYQDQKYHADYKIGALKHDIANLSKQIKDLKDFWLLDGATA